MKLTAWRQLSHKFLMNTQQVVTVYIFYCPENEEEGWPPSQKRVNSAQYEQVVELLIMHKAKTDFRSCLMIDLGRETDGNNEICLGVRFCLVHNYILLS